MKVRWLFRDESVILNDVLRKKDATLEAWGVTPEKSQLILEIWHKSQPWENWVVW